MDSLRRKLVWLVVSRAAILGVLFVLVMLLGRGSPYSGPVSLLCLIVSALSLIYAIALQAGLSPHVLIPLQLGNDVLLVTWLVYRTNDIMSPFNALYMVVVFAASLLSSRRGIVATTLFSICLSAAMTAAVLTEVLPRADLAAPYEATEIPAIQYNFAFTIVAILAVSVLSTKLSDRQRQSDLELAAATRHLADLRALNERIIDSMRSGLATADLAGRVASFNRAAEEITGRAAQEVIGLPLDALFGAVAEQLQGLAREGTESRSAAAARSDVVYTRPDGSVAHLGFNVAPLTAEDGAETGLVLIFQDLTEIFELEQEVRRQEKLAAVGTMAAGLAHEIRNPLTSMRGSVQVLAAELALDEDQQRLMQIVIRESDRLNRTVTDFLAYARPAPTSRDHFDLKRAIADSVVLLRNNPDLGPGHEIVEIYPEEDVTFFGDSNQIRQIFWNLARNGLQAMPHGGRLVVRLEQAPSGACWLHVEDEGCGMTQQQLDCLFEPFASSKGSTGLGMAIVYQLVRDHGGRIAVDSAPGDGTRIQVWLPARRQDSTVSPDAVYQPGAKARTRGSGPFSKDQNAETLSR